MADIAELHVCSSACCSIVRGWSEITPRSQFTDSSPMTAGTASQIGLYFDVKVSIFVLLSFSFNLWCSHML